MRQEIRDIINRAIDAQETLLPAAIDRSAGDATPIFGEGAPFDSMGLVALIVQIEEMVESETGAALTLVSEKAMSAHRSPFATISTLGEFIESLLLEDSRV
ncbi:hypothetical protein PQR14_06120 [Paraburkholderia bryophila]|uniref:hypothetical protein n=1 Tax=Burkholderiaceae TaxID=119060 RepID=UPI000690163F|nr:hypothetical protein [Burkholderia sp. 9120]